jgi:hypothetical protein
MGSAVDQANLSRELERFKAAGLGGVHIIPIYQAKGYEARDRAYLSPAWMAALEHVLRDARRLGLGVDMTTGTGWCFGGPTITADLAAAKLVTDARDAPHGTALRARYDPARLDALVAVNTDTGSREDLRGRLAADGSLDWTPPQGRWRVYALSSTPSIRVKRAAPGGEGWMLDPFSRRAVETFLAPFTQAFAAHPDARPRAMYHDSFEYGADWSRGLLDAFARRRGYRLEDEIAAFVDGAPEDRAARVKHDYRQTLDELLIDEAFPAWTAWSRAHGMIARNEAHGAPANLLDFYALADVPETEMFRNDRDTRVSRVAASAAHVEGRRLVASETGTWIAEHFHETLAGLKDLVDQLFVAGVNHVFWHGSAYSPDEAPWPGWTFYASTQMNARNAIWRDAPALHAYIARVQETLQAGRPESDVLVYWPIHDLWSDPQGTTIPLTIHAPAWMAGQSIGRAASALDRQGLAYDFVSDRQLARVTGAPGAVEAPGASYRTLLVPRARLLPIETLARLLAIARDGATVAFEDALPTDVPGLSRLEERRAELRRLLGEIRLEPSTRGPATRRADVGKGLVEVGPLAELMSSLAGERLQDAGLEFIRRRTGDHATYFVVNRTANRVRAWMPLAKEDGPVIAHDPMTGASGVLPALENPHGVPLFFLALDAGASILLQTGDAPDEPAPPFRFSKADGEGVTLDGPWDLEFIDGGPERPEPRQGVGLGSWTDLGDPHAVAFAGTARYRTSFESPRLSGVKTWLLDLGQVRESARVRLNGRDLGTLIGPSYRVVVEARDVRWNGNVLEIEVTNLSANRIRDLDRRKVPWRLFHDINVVNIDYKPFDASGWDVRPSGLLGPVTLTPAVVDEGRDLIP